VGRRDIESELLHQPRQPGRLAFGQLEHEPGERRCVDDRVLQRAFQSPADEPGVKGVVTVLDEDRALRETKERPASVTKFRRSDQHRPVDVVPLLGVGIDRCTAVDERVEKRQRAGKLESLSAQLEHQEWRVAGSLDVDGDELGFVQHGQWPDLRCIDRDLLPRHRLGGAARLQEDRLHVRIA
jgi:hypothetical protein